MNLVCKVSVKNHQLLKSYNQPEIVEYRLNFSKIEYLYIKHLLYLANIKYKHNGNHPRLSVSVFGFFKIIPRIY